MRKILILLGTLLLFLRGSAQTEEEKEKIKSKNNNTQLKLLSSIYKNKYEENRKLALKLSNTNGWPVKQYLNNEGVRILVGVTPNLKPIYAETLNFGSSITSRTNKLYTGGGLGLNVHGQGMTVGEWDGEGVQTCHELLEGRALQWDSPPSIASHATRVAGTLIGSDQFQSGNARGMAYKANLLANDLIYDFTEMTTLIADSGLLLSNHSYTTGLVSQYSGRTEDVDEIMYNAPTYLSVWAAGNSSGTGVLSNEGCSKNGITVGNVWEVLEYTGPSSVVAASLGSYTSNGPTDDYRIKPDLVTKGQIVYSSRYDVDNPSACNLYGNGWGTSHAAPGITGTLLLLQEYYESITGDFMLAATLKALAIHTADEAGSNPGPDIVFGWGLMNAQRAVQVIGNVDPPNGILENSLSNGTNYTRTVTARGSQPLVATICWTDPEGTATSDNDTTPQLVNDLDLKITSGSNTYYPWRIDQSNVSGAALNDDDNDRDNVEKVEIASPIAGQSYTITVNHKGTLASAQAYSLIFSGTTEDCPLYQYITGTYGAALTHASTWIKSIGQTTISPTASVKLDADDTDGYVEISPGASDYFVSAPSSGVFIAQALDGCGSSVPSRNPGTKTPRPIKYYNNKPQDNKLITTIPSSGFSVFPNPTQSEFVINSSVELTKATIKVYDASGKLQNIKVMDAGLHQRKIKMDPSAKGVYLIQVITSEKIETEKIVVL